MFHNIIKTEDDFYRIYGLIVSQFELMLEAKELRNESADIDRIASMLKANPYRLKKAIVFAERAGTSKIKEILPYGSRPADKDYGDKRVVPGFIDIHTHGAYGFDTNDAEEEGLRNWMKNIPEEGVTGILPTTITQSEEVLTKAVANVAKVVEEGYEGAEILGIHFEGPYLDQVYKGAQPEQYCVAPDVEQFKRYQKAANGLIKVVTMAPEHDEGFQLLHYLNGRDLSARGIEKVVAARLYPPLVTGIGEQRLDGRRISLISPVG